MEEQDLKNEISSRDQLKELIEGSFNEIEKRLSILRNDFNSTKEYCEKALDDHKQTILINEIKTLGTKIDNLSGRLTKVETKLNGEDDE